METKRGRPKIENLYEKWVAGKEEAITAACRLGADSSGLAKILGCGKTTLFKLQRQYDEFKELIKEGKEVADAKVESALYRRAVGYDYEEVTTRVVVDKSGVGSVTHVTKVKKHVIPDTTAQIFWLKNRKQYEWRDKQDMDVTTAGESINRKNVDIDCLTEDERQALIDISLKIEENNRE